MKKAGRAWANWPNAACILVSAAIAVFIHFQLKAIQQDGAARLQYLHTELAKLDTETAEVRGLRTKIGDFLGRKNVIEALQKHRMAFVGLLDEIARLRPPGIALRSIDVEQSRAAVAGYASSQKAVDDFVANFPASSRLGPPQEVVTEAVNGAYPFRFSFKSALRAGPEKGR